MRAAGGKQKPKPKHPGLRTQTEVHGTFGNARGRLNPDFFSLCAPSSNYNPICCSVPFRSVAHVDRALRLAPSRPVAVQLVISVAVVGCSVYLYNRVSPPPPPPPPPPSVPEREHALFGHAPFEELVYNERERLLEELHEPGEVELLPEGEAEARRAK